MPDNVTVKNVQPAIIPSQWTDESYDVASDDVGGVQYQRVKLDIGADGVSSPVTSLNPMPVSGTVTATVSGVATETTLGNVKTELQTLNSLVPSKYDYVSLSYTGSNLTSVVFKTGGSGGTTVSTLTLAYDGSSNLTSVTKT